MLVTMKFDGDPGNTASENGGIGVYGNSDLFINGAAMKTMLNPYSDSAT